MRMFTFHDADVARIAATAAAGNWRMEDEGGDDDDGEGGGTTDEELAAQARRMLEKRGGSGEALAITLLNDNQKARARARTAEKALRDARAKIPKDDQAVVSKADAELLVKYKAHGTPEEVKTKIDKTATLEAAEKQRTIGETVAEAASLAKLNGKLLAKLADPSRENFIVELRDETKDGKPVKVPYARKNEANSPMKPLAEFVKTELAEYGPALVATSDGKGATTETTHTTSYPEQSQSSTAPASGKVDAFIKTRNEQAAARPNPLAPPQAAVVKTT